MLYPASPSKSPARRAKTLASAPKSFMPSLLKLAGKTGRFIAPLGVGDQLIAWGIDPSRVTQLDWWQSTEVAGCA